MWLMLQQDVPDDYVIATGETHSVREFLEVAFNHAGLDYADHVKIDPKYYRPAEVDLLIGDASKAREQLGWSAQTGFEGPRQTDGRRRHRPAEQAEHEGRVRCCAKMRDARTSSKPLRPINYLCLGVDSLIFFRNLQIEACTGACLVLLCEPNTRHASGGFSVPLSKSCYNRIILGTSRPARRG